MSKYEFFADTELACKCGCGKGADDMNPEFMTKIIKIRRHLNRPLIITSAFRCPAHNAAESHTGYKGPHTTGRAIDIVANPAQKVELIAAALALGFKRIGIAKTFIHLDDLTDKEGFPYPAIWIY